MEYYFPFHILVEYANIMTAVGLSIAGFVLIYTLASLYYWTWKTQYVGPERRKVPRTTWKSETTTTVFTAPPPPVVVPVPPEPTKERKRRNTKVRQPVAPKKRTKHPKI